MFRCVWDATHLSNSVITFHMSTSGIKHVQTNQTSYTQTDIMHEPIRFLMGSVVLSTAYFEHCISKSTVAEIMKTKRMKTVLSINILRYNSLFLEPNSSCHVMSAIYFTTFPTLPV